MGVFREFEVWPKIYHRSFCALCNIVFYCTYRDISRVYCDMYAHHKRFNLISLGLVPINLPICFRVISLVLQQAYNCPSPVGVSSMMTSSNGNIFRISDLLCGEFTGPRWIPSTKAFDAELWCFLYLRPNKQLSEQSWGWWIETPSCSLRRHCNVKNCAQTRNANPFKSVTKPNKRLVCIISEVNLFCEAHIINTYILHKENYICHTACTTVSLP